MKTLLMAVAVLFLAGFALAEEGNAWVPADKLLREKKEFAKKVEALEKKNQALAEQNKGLAEKAKGQAKAALPAGTWEVVEHPEKYTQGDTQFVQLLLRRGEKRRTVFADANKAPQALLVHKDDWVHCQLRRHRRKMLVDALTLIGRNGLPMRLQHETRAKRVKAIDASKNPIVVTTADGQKYMVDWVQCPWYETMLKRRWARNRVLVVFGYLKRGTDRWVQYAETHSLAGERIRYEKNAGPAMLIASIVKEDNHIFRITTGNGLTFWIDGRFYFPARFLRAGQRVPFGALYWRNRVWDPRGWYWYGWGSHSGHYSNYNRVDVRVYAPRLNGGHGARNGVRKGWRGGKGCARGGHRR